MKPDEEKRDKLARAVVGLSDGSILLWSLRERGNKDKPLVFKEHQGAVQCMIWVDDFAPGGLLFTGSADRTIKVWDVSGECTSPCVSTLHGHGGTILSMCYGHGMLLSSSTDGSVLLWKPDPLRQLLRYPAFVLRQRLGDSKSASRVQRENRCWVNALSIREGESFSVFAGDSEGNLTIFKPEKATTKSKTGDVVLTFHKKLKIHDNGVLALVAIPLESFLFSLAYDQKLKAFDALSAAPIFEEVNPSSRFTSFAWDATHQDLMVADNKGDMRVYNIYAESCVECQTISEEKVVALHLESPTRLWVLTPHEVQLFHVTRGVKYAHAKEHTQRIVNLASRQTEQGGLLYTASADMTLRWWDLETLREIKVITEEKSEPTALVYLPCTNVLCTGHENGELKLWSVEYVSVTEMRDRNDDKVHTNSISCLCVVPLTQHEDAQGASEVVVAGSFDYQLSVWRILQTDDGTTVAKVEAVFRAHQYDDDEVLCVAYAQAQAAIFSAGNRGTIHRWSIDPPGKKICEYADHEDAVTGFAVDQLLLYSSSADCTIKVWETSGNYLLHTISDLHTSPIQALAVLPSSGIVCSCAGGRLVLWDPSSREVVTTFTQNQDFCCLLVSEPQRVIVVGTEAGPLTLFPIPELEQEKQEGAEPKDMASDLDEAENAASLEVLDRMLAQNGLK